MPQVGRKQDQLSSGWPDNMRGGRLGGIIDRVRLQATGIEVLERTAVGVVHRCSARRSLHVEDARPGRCHGACGVVVERNASLHQSWRACQRTREEDGGKRRHSGVRKSGRLSTHAVVKMVDDSSYHARVGINVPYNLSVADMAQKRRTPSNNNCEPVFPIMGIGQVVRMN